MTSRLTARFIRPSNPTCLTRWSSCSKLMVWAVIATLLASASASAQEGSILQGVVQAKLDAAQAQPNQIVQTDCSSCSSGLFGSHGGSVGCSSCGQGSCGGCGGACFPGQLCESCEGSGFIGRVFAKLHNCVCCPDPCYEPRWIGAANAAFFQDSARPVNQTRIRWDHGIDLIHPDRNSFFFAQTSDVTKLRGIDYDELRLSMEAGTERFSVTVDTPYRYWTSNESSKAGFGDISIATKSLLLDCELIQMAFQFRTGVPTASDGNGLGNGTVSLEPSLLFTVKLLENTYFQSQIAEWIPLNPGGTRGSLLHYHFAFNHMLWQAPCCKDMQLIGTFEVNGYSFQAGKYTGLVNNETEPLNSSGTTYITLGPGLRYQLCDRMDLGFGASFAVSKDHFADQLYRTEFRWRF